MQDSSDEFGQAVEQVVQVAVSREVGCRYGQCVVHKCNIDPENTKPMWLSKNLI